MPTYEYICEQCKFKLEAFQQMTDKPLTQCPKCFGHLKRKIGSGSGIIFKGTGFWETDGKKKKGNKE